jgi:hypothetical protein
MRVRYIVVLLFIGFYFAQMNNSAIEAYVTVLICTTAYGLRKIEGQLVRLNTNTIEPTDDAFKDRLIALVNKMDGRIIRPPPTPQDDPSRCGSRGGMKTMDRLHTCPDMGCPQPDFSSRN